MENTQTFIMTDDRVNFSLKRLKSFKTSRILSPIALLFINYLFIFALFGYNSYARILIIYLSFCVLTTVVTYFITTKAIKRYNNIIIEIRISDINTLSAITLSKNNFQIKKGDYTTGTYSLTDNRKFDTIVLICGDNRFEVIPEWFTDNGKLKNLFI